MRNRRGSIIVLTLALIVIIAMYSTALVATNARLFGSSRRSQDLTAALALGQGGLNRLLQHLTQDATFNGALSDGDARTGYDITFAPAAPLRSVNNLNSDTVSAGTNYQGQPVPPYTADVIVEARSNGVARRLRFVLTRGVAYRGAMGANGRIVFGDHASLRSYTSLTDHTPVACQFHSNGAGVEWVGPPRTFTIGPLCELTSFGAVEPAIEAANPGMTSSNMPRIPIPELDVASMVASASSSPAPVVLPRGLLCESQTYLAGDQVVNGNINLANGSLFVQGNLTIHGGLIGYGSVYATGDIQILGGNATVITNQPNGAAVLAGGDIVFDGLDATGYLDILAATHPATVGAAWTEAKSMLELMDDVTLQPPAGYARPGAFATVAGLPDGWLTAAPFASFAQLVDVWWVKYRLGNAGALGGNVQPMRVPNPDGTFAQWTDGATLRKVRDAVEALPTYATDPRAQQVSNALDQMAHFYRHTWDGAWHEGDLGDPYFNLDHQLWTVRGFADPSGAGYAGYWYSGDPNADQAKTNKYVQDFLENNPTPSELGRAFFQGVLYANGSVTLANDAAVIGSVVSGGDLTLGGEANFIYNKEYDSITNNALGPVRVASYNEL